MDRHDDIHYKIFKKVKAYANKIEGETSSLLKKYKADQKKFSKRAFKPSSEDELIQSIKKSNITYIGDFHTFDQNQKNLTRIVKATVDHNSKVLIGLEMVDYIYSDKITAYLNRHITELEFLESINYHDSWRFPWNHYKLIFELARKYSNLNLIGLNSRGSLKERDQFAAALLAEHIKADPDCSIIVLFGEYHIVPNKIPAYTNNNLKDLAIKQVIVHQNLDEVYFTLKENKQDYSVVKFNSEEFCITTSPPWVKYESQIYWFENLDNDPDFDLHEYMIEHGTKIFSDSSHDNFYELLKEVIYSLKLDIDLYDLSDFDLKDHTQLDYVQDMLVSEYSKKLQVFFQKLIINRSSFHLPGTSLFYCSNYSLNRLSYLVGTFIFLNYAKHNKLDEKTILNSSKNSTIFIYFTYNKIISYFISRFINPKRKCNLYLDFKIDNSTNSKRVIKILDDYKNFQHYLTKLSMKSIFDLSQKIGHLLGDYMYVEFIKKGQDEIIKHLLENIDTNELSFIKMIDDLLSDHDYKKHQKRLF